VEEPLIALRPAKNLLSFTFFMLNRLLPIHGGLSLARGLAASQCKD